MTLKMVFLPPAGGIDRLEGSKAIRSWLTHAVYTGGVIALARVAGLVAQDAISTMTGNAILGAGAGCVVEMTALIGSRGIERRIAHVQPEAVRVGQLAGLLTTHVVFRSDPIISWAFGAAVGAMTAGRWSMIEDLEET